MRCAQPRSFCRKPRRRSQSSAMLQTHTRKRGRNATRLEAPVLVAQCVIQDPALHIPIVRADSGIATVEDVTPSASDLPWMVRCRRRRGARVAAFGAAEAGRGRAQRRERDVARLHRRPAVPPAEKQLDLSLLLLLDAGLQPFLQMLLKASRADRAGSRMDACRAMRLTSLAELS